MTGGDWVLVGGLALISFAQRTLPWVMVARWRIKGRMARWLQHLAPAAFATLVVVDLPRGPSVMVMGSLVLAGLVAWRTKNLGLTVLAGMVVGVLPLLGGKTFF